MTQVAPDGQTDIELLKDEVGGLMMEMGITTISFYKGDFTAAVEAVRAQFALVVASNVWLAGRLVKTKGGIRLRHPTSPSATDINALITSTSAADEGAFKLSPTAAYCTTCTDMYASKKVIVKNGGGLVGKNEPLIILTLSESAAGEFALIFSMSHVIGDGRTYYEVFQMLQPGAAVRTLATARVQSFSEEMRDMCGRKELEWADQPGAMCMYTCSMMCCAKQKPTCHAFHVDPERLAAAKAAGAKDSGVEYVTTNDILTSAFFTECDSRIGMMGMDCRGRVAGIEQDMAGNYVTALTMDPTTFATPATVRKMLTSTPHVTTSQPLPTCCGWMCGKDSANFAMATNWSSFAGGMVQLEGCELTVHLPVQNPAYCVFDLMIPFASGVGKIGVIIWTVSSDADGLKHALPVGDCVSTALFPSEGA